MNAPVDIPYDFYARSVSSFAELMRKSGHDKAIDMIGEAIEVYDFYEDKIVSGCNMMVAYFEGSEHDHLPLDDKITPGPDGRRLIEARTFPVPVEQFDSPPDKDELAAMGLRLTKALALYEALIDARQRKMQPGLYQFSTGDITPINFVFESEVPLPEDSFRVAVPTGRHLH